MSQHYADYPPATQRIIDKIILLGIRIWRREQQQEADRPRPTEIAS